MTTIEIRDARTDDLPAVLEIYNDIVATSTAVYSVSPSTLEERRTWFTTRKETGFPVLVATNSDGVIGFSSFGEFRGAWPGYRHSVEHSVHVRQGYRRIGAGKKLVQALFPQAAAMSKHVIVGGIDADNAASLLMHESLGFERVAHFREIGHKFGRWLDLVFVQRFIDEHSAKRMD